MHSVLTVALFLCFRVASGNEYSLQTTGICQGKELLPKVEMTKHCSKAEVVIDGAVRVFPSSKEFSEFPNCLKCNVTLRTSASKQLTATIYSIGTQTGPDGICDANRLDIYDGDRVDKEKLLSNKTGICGCNLPTEGAFKSTKNIMTLTFNTWCKNVTKHGEFDLVIAAVDNDEYNKTDCSGYFECSNGLCIDKNLVCNDHFDCADHSDETNCTARNGTCPGKFECQNGQCIDKNLVCNGVNNCVDKSDEINCKAKPPKLLLYILIGIAGLFVLILIVILVVLCYRYCFYTGSMAAVYRRI